MELPIYQVDAFASRMFAGNPAAVCPLEDWLSDATMQAIAAENNLSETAFFVKTGDGSFDLRWFTPAVEVDLCGHATLGSAFVIANYLEPTLSEIRFQSRSGPLTVTRDGDLFTLDFPARRPRRVADDAELAAALGATPAELWRDRNAMAVFASQAEVTALAPDMAALAAFDAGGVIATAPGADCDFVSRYFAPRVGIPEDPVTGSAHCELAPYWATRLDRGRMSARQISARGGELTVALRGERVLISGRVAPYLQGRIRV